MLKFLNTVKKLAEQKNLCEEFYSRYVLCYNSQEKMSSWMKYNNISDPVSPEDLHCTLIFSRVNPMNYEPSDTPIDIDLSLSKFGHLGPNNEPSATVLLLPIVSALKQRYNLVKSKGAISDFPDYIPHITLSYKPFDYSRLTVPNFTITLEREYIKWS